MSIKTSFHKVTSIHKSKIERLDIHTYVFDMIITTADGSKASFTFFSRNKIDLELKGGDPDVS